jgi:Zn-dependent protease
MTPGEASEIRGLEREGAGSDGAKLGMLRIASFFGAPIYVHVSWVVIPALLSWALSAGYFPALHLERPLAPYWAVAGVASGLALLSVLLHEMGHAVVALKHGLTVRSITLSLFGGVTQMEKDPEEGWTELKLAAAGPVVSLALASLFYLAAATPLLGETGRLVTSYMAYTSLGLGILNVLPAFPLDGGRLLRAVLWIHVGKLRATRITSGTGTLLAVGLSSFGFFRLLAGDRVTAMCCIVVGWLLKDAAATAYGRVRLHEALRGLAVRDAMLTEVATIPAHLALSELAPEHFLRGGYSSYPVVRGEGAVGLLSVRAVVALSAEERERTSVQAVMTPLGEHVVVGPGEPLLGAMARMARSELGRLLVVEDGRLAGLLSMSSVFRQIRMREALSS